MATKKSKKPTVSSQLAKALRGRTLVQFSRPFDEGTVDGYVLDIGPRFFLLASLGDGMWLDGYQCFRVSDVRALRVPHPHAAFAEAALKKRGERLPKKPNIDLGSTTAMLRSAGRAFPLIVIHHETIEPDVCLIGRVMEVTDDFVSLLEINPDAKWDKAPTRYSLKEITQVTFGTGYEDALHLVGGDKK